MKSGSLLLAFAGIALAAPALAACPIPPDAHTVTQSAMTVTGPTLEVLNGRWHHAGPMYVTVAERPDGTAVFSKPDSPDNSGCLVLTKNIKVPFGRAYIAPHSEVAVRLDDGGVTMVAFAGDDDSSIFFREFWR